MTDTSLSAIFADETPAAEPTEPVEQVEQGTGVDESGTPTDDGQQEQQDDPIEKHRKGLEAGIAAERQKRQAVERELAEMRAAIQRQERQNAPKQQQTSIERPKRDAYESQEDYEDALLEYGDRRREIRTAQERAQQEQQEFEQQIERTANEVIGKGQQAFQDFDAVINSGLGPFLAQQTPQAQLFRQSLLSGDRAHEVAYYLAKNQEEAQRVYSMQPLQMVRAIALIEATKLTQDEADAAPKPVIPRTLTQARDARGQFTEKTYDGPTPLDAILAKKR
jgi:hypothetical protein